MPSYQRPYSWKTSNVEKLLESFYDNMWHQTIDPATGCYRVGSLIVHKKDSTLDIVDGQQRLTTISLISLALNPERSDKRLSDMVVYNHSESIKNIRQNFAYIKEWIGRNLVDESGRQRFESFMLEQCTMVVIACDDLSEAFQMFDSQNGRGKELEAYNLLKAYHLRAIDGERERIEVSEDKKKYDHQWEAAALKRVDYEGRVNKKGTTSLLNQITTLLFRNRRWKRLSNAWHFGKPNIDEFKGIRINGKADLPLNNLSLMLFMLYRKQNSDLISSLLEASAAHRSSHQKDINPFVSINMDIVNGELFFAYIQTYVEAYKRLFGKDDTNDHELNLFREKFSKWTRGYYKWDRIGDSYIREEFIASLILLYDRFGEEELFKRAGILFVIAYAKRSAKRVETATVTNQFSEKNNYFSIISRATSARDLGKLTQIAISRFEKAETFEGPNGFDSLKEMMRNELGGNRK